MNEIFDNYVETSFEGEGQATPKFKQFEYNYRKLFPADTTEQVLDIGIGRGEMISCMNNWGYSNYLGVDISKSTVEYCKNLGLNVELIADTRTWLQQHEQSFSLITLLDVLEHVPKHEVVSFLKDVKTALKPGGVLIIQVPNLQAPDSQLHRYNDFTHESGFVENSMKQVLLAAGFKDFYFRGFEIFVHASLVERVARIGRYIYWQITKILRKLNTNLSPNILNPVFFAVVKK